MMHMREGVPWRSRFISILIVCLLAADPTGLAAPGTVHAAVPPAGAYDLALLAVPAANSIFLAWAPVQGAEIYRVQVMDPFELIFKTLDELNGDASSYLMSNLQPRQHYQLRVEACQGGDLLASGNVEVYTLSFQVWLPRLLR